MTHNLEAVGFTQPGAAAPGSELAHADLREYKSVARERSRAGGTLHFVGHLADGTDPAIWTGPVSLRDRINSGELSQADLHAAECLLWEHFVPVTEGAPVECVEDRTAVGYDSRNVLRYGAPRGPKFQGGTADEGVVHRLIKITNGDTSIGPLAILQDIVEVVNRPNRRYRPGGHTGSTVVLGATGCGSVDSQELKLASYRNPSAAEAIRDKTDVIAGLGGVTLDPGYFDRLRDSAAELHDLASVYFNEQLISALDTVRRFSGEDLPHVEGKHPAFAVVLDFVPGDTLHTSEYNVKVKEATGKDISAFCLDVWHLFEEHPPETAARLIAQGINTFTHLTDGSLRLYVRQPN